MSTMSLSPARLQPSPTAGPFTAAMIGTSMLAMPRTMTAPSSMIAARRSVSWTMRSRRLRSPPPENARPAPVITSASMSVSAASRSHTWASAPWSTSLVALNASGRFSVSSRTAPCDSTSRTSSEFSVIAALYGGQVVGAVLGGPACVCFVPTGSTAHSGVTPQPSP